MKEDFLHYLWQYKKFDSSNLMTVDGEKLSIITFGDYLQNAGSDFFNAQIKIDDQKWAGNIEIHSKSSDWYVHHHEDDPNYDNVILHVVWEHDTPVFRKNNSEIPVLQLKDFTSSDIIQQYTSLAAPKTWIYCENQLPTINQFLLENWQERLYFERLTRKNQFINQLLDETQNDWEAVLFCLLAKNFGLNANGETFLKIAKAIPFSILRKESYEVKNIESLFFGIANLLPTDGQEEYTKDLKQRFQYLMHKYQFEKVVVEPVQFFKHRPDNFPTIRLAQLAMLYHKEQNLFSKVISINSIEELYEVFKISISEYWQYHYHFDKVSAKKKHSFSKSFIDLLVINTIVPIRFAYAKSQGNEISETVLHLLKEVTAEKNSILDSFSKFGIKAKNAFESQSLLELKNQYCSLKKCLQCGIGIQLLKT